MKWAGIAAIPTGIASWQASVQGWIAENWIIVAVAVGLILFNASIGAWLSRSKRDGESSDQSITISRRSPRNMGGQAILGGIIRLDKEAETQQYTSLHCLPGKPEGTLPIVIDIEELVGVPIENTFDWTIQVQNVVIITRNSEPITCRVYLTVDCGSYRAKAEAKSDYVLRSPITIASEAQSGTFVFQLMERIRGAGPVNSPNRLWGDLELAFLEVGTDRSLYIPFAVIQSIPDTEDSPTQGVE